MDKKYQVFVSSTYEDLQEERKKVMEALLQMNCFPVGMEYFNASDDSQWEVIKSLIRECDYYVLIVAGRYGSIEEESWKSYTQKEFEYAIEQGVPVISFVHKHPESLPAAKYEQDPLKREKLEEFKSFVQKKLCKMWDNADGLSSQVVLSLISLIKSHPRTGWIKADEISSAEANKEILALRKENDELKVLLAKKNVDNPEGIENLQQGEDEIKFILQDTWNNSTYEITSTWNTIISILAPLMIDECAEKALRDGLSSYFRFNYNLTGGFNIINNDFQTIKVQLIALQIIQKSDRKRTAKDTDTYWTLTPYGNRLMMQLKALKR